MTPEEQKRISKKLSYLLRHHPEAVGLTVDKQGWARIDELLGCLAQDQFPVSREQLDIVVTENPKQRFLISPDGMAIRASQGHSIPVELGLLAVMPPQKLFHGTATKNVESIQNQGLIKGSRNHVHLSVDHTTAKSVGQRHGKPVILTVKALEMHQAGFEFFISDNGVWLTDHVPVDYLGFPQGR
ncbi:MAG TPA: RNA 2'-phosphotransferase [Cytophagales bacterium]|nr:RNA 2'-phosphotransferase [Cytophagales bacterium]HAA19888.1 RNA 2'-phosphotransferase [Cytophagales bacterium]HAP62685.1 RNA 2'-phosphotransferase [Cytophagales bacterium]